MKFHSLLLFLASFAICLGASSASHLCQSRNQTCNWGNGSNSSNGTNTTQLAAQNLFDLKWAKCGSSSAYLDLVVSGLEGAYSPNKRHSVYASGKVKKSFQPGSIRVTVKSKGVLVYSTVEKWNLPTFPVGVMPPLLVMDRMPFIAQKGSYELSAILKDTAGVDLQCFKATFKMA